MNWPHMKKIRVTLLYGMTTMCATFVSTLHNAGRTSLMGERHRVSFLRLVRSSRESMGSHQRSLSWVYPYSSSVSLLSASYAGPRFDLGFHKVSLWVLSCSDLSPRYTEGGLPLSSRCSCSSASVPLRRQQRICKQSLSQDSLAECA